MMTPAELEHAHQCMQQRWYDVVEAERQGVAEQELERMYEQYICSVEAYNRGSQPAPPIQSSHPAMPYR